ncbi:Glutathione S-transferase 3 [Apostasia shenzhenica]|uniref:glutathione transferase n=1 Tax=Apostasia shenzhenica TaxID=1088818 RepID=A0A2I0AQ53_9ASPA|nr:Glutathione S-transferase 3 [Apostasia shenzhenica]
MAPLKLYGAAASTNTARAVAVLNELGLDYDFITVDLSGGANKKPDFLTLNPFGLVPAFEDGDIKLFESRAIAKYLAAHYGPGLLKSASKAESAAVEVWLEVESQEFNPPASAIVSEGLLKPLLYGGSPDLVVVRAQEAKLGQTPQERLITSRPHVKSWWEQISARPGWKKAAAAIPF